MKDDPFRCAQFQISSSDRIFGDAPLTYSIVSGNVDGAFEVDNDGRIMTTQQLDREIEHEYLLKIVGNGHHNVVPETAVRIRGLLIFVPKKYEDFLILIPECPLTSS